jgi:hypothetical protein
VADAVTGSAVVPIGAAAAAREDVIPSREDAVSPTGEPPGRGSAAQSTEKFDPTQERDALAERFFTKDLADQRKWYSQRAASFKKRSELLGLLTIVLGALITFIQTFGVAKWVPIVSGSIGAIVAIAAGWQRIARYHETWISYRTASERMKRERRLYTHGAGSYRGLVEREAFVTFVEAIEAIIAEEQNIFWRERGNNPPAASGNSEGKIAGAPSATQ